MTERRCQIGRRDFLTGTAAGVAASMGVGQAVARARGPEFPDGATPSYAQCGEDVAVRDLLAHRGLTRPTYLDIGAFHPVHISNTYLFYTMGARGVLVEPNPDLAGAIRSARPGDTLLTVGIGVGEATSAEYYRMTLPAWNTFSREEADRMVADNAGRARIEEVIALPLVGVNAVIASHFGGKAPDFLSIDVESLDLAILRTLDFARFRPRVICAETLVPMTGRMDPEIGAFLATRGYEARCMTFANTIYVDRSWYAG
jgi:FkbM family methyltransferase